MRVTSRGTFVGCVVVLLAVTVGTPVASASGAVRCGQVITRNTTLTRDVGPCAGNGLVVAGDHVTLDLNRHRVFGTAAPEAQHDVAGILFRSTTGAKVTGGTVDHFAAGVVIERGSANTVEHLAVHDNITACEREVHTQSPGLFGDGILVLSSVRNRVRHNLVQHNGPFSGISLVAETDRSTGQLTGRVPAGNVVNDNLVQDTNTCFGDIGIRIEGPGATHNIVSGNTVERTFLEGIALLSVLNFDVSGFGVTCGDPIAFPNLPPCPPFNPPNPANAGNLVVGNRAVANALGQHRSGITLLAFPDTVNPMDNTIRGNQAEGNGGSGISVIGGALGPGVTYGATHNTLVGNTSVGNNQDRCTFATCGGPRFDLIDDSADRPCDHNVWRQNVYGTAHPRCTTVDGTPVRSASVEDGATTTPAAPARPVRFSPRFLG